MDLMQTLVNIAAIFVTPDWGALVGLIPVGLALLVALYFAWTIRRFATAGPTRRGPARVAPLPPPGLHMPGPSIAPILVAFGAGSLFFGLIVGGPAILAGAAVLVLTLLAWGREALRDYDHVEPASSLPAVVHAGPPPGVHMPGPSIRPLLGALGGASLMAGLVIGGWVLVVAVVFLAWVLTGWLVDATAEFRKVEEADRTGHLENITPRRFPSRALQVFVLVFVLVALVQVGALPPTGASAGGAAASAGASAGPSVAPGTLTVTAKNIAYDTQSLQVAAGKPFSILFKNDDPAGIPHNIEIRAGDGTVLQDQPTIDGGTSTTYDYSALPPGTYTFICKIHPIPAMTGTLTVK
jgi:plastocyanin